jgi:signal transduction histidine kinase
MRAQQPRRKGTTIWTQVLFIALVPSIAVVIVGAVASAYLVRQGLAVSGFAGDVHAAYEPISRFVTSTQEERRLTMLRSLGSQGGTSAQDLETQRSRVNETMTDLENAADRISDGASEDLRGTLTRLTEATHGLPAMRQQFDGGVIDAWKAYHNYDDLLDLCGAVIQGIARSASDADVAFEQMISYDLFKSAEAMSRSHAMAAKAVASGVDGTQFHELAHQLGMYHEQVESVVPRMTAQEKDLYAALKKTPGWSALVAGDNALMFRGPTFAKPTFDVPTWQNGAQQVGEALMGLYQSHSRYAASLATGRGSSTFLASIVAGAAILLIALVSILIALRLSRRLVRRLRGLRRETLDVVHTGLPQLMSTIRAGNPIDVEKQVAKLDYGGDELGQVADAFNAAQRSAITAAVREAETRQGVRAVFLNIARRSQVIVHRQLKVLDQAERSVDDPDQLQTLFQLDHLATRSRRNAENLIILAGEQPGRQWRNPIPLRDVVRSAIAETEQYTRVVTTQIPELSVIGTAVADIVHLLAELIDNGAEFSPQDSTVEVRGHVVGRGAVVEIEDQGLGMEQELLDQLNAMLHHPPDFNVMALSTESRVGLFVVARLAERHGIKVSVRDSDFGGSRAIVLIPAGRLVATAPAGAEPVAEPAVPQQFEPVRNGTRMVGGAGGAKPPLPRRERQANLAPQLTDPLPEGSPVTPPTVNEGELLRRSERLRRSMSAFQQGTRQGRSTNGSGGGEGGHDGASWHG